MNLYLFHPNFSKSFRGYCNNYINYSRSSYPNFYLSEKNTRRKFKNRIIKSNNIIEYIISSIKSHNLDPSFFNFLYSKYTDDCELEPEDRIDPIDGNEKSIINVFRNGSFDETPESVILSIKKQIEKTVASISTGDIPIININDLSENINKLVHFSGIETDQLPIINGETSISSIITITSNHTGGIQIKLRDNRKIVLSMDGNDIENYGHEELFQILSVLDVISDGDSRIDDLRSKIVDFLAVPKKDSRFVFLSRDSNLQKGR